MPRSSVRAGGLPALLVGVGLGLGAGFVAGPAPASAQAPGDAWLRHPGVNGPVDHLAFDGAGTLWARSSGSPSASARVAALRAGRVQDAGTLRGLVARHYAELVRQGDLADFWAVDGAGRVWVGPAYYDGRGWVELAPSAGGGIERIFYEERVLLDAKGQAWVPFQAERSCPIPALCGRRGLRAFTPAGPTEGAILFEALPEADAYGLPHVSLVPARDLAKPGSAPALDAAEPAAAARAALYRPPEAAPLRYPLLGPPLPGQLRNAGYATFATASGSGDLLVLTWVERHDAPAVAYALRAERLGPDGVWARSEDLSDIPTREASIRDLRLVATAGAPSAEAGTDAGSWWLATSAGEVIERRGSRWGRHFGPAEIGLGGAGGIRDLAGDAERGLWLAGEDGLFVFGVDLPEDEGRAYLPLAVTARGPAPR